MMKYTTVELIKRMRCFQYNNDSEHEEGVNIDTLQVFQQIAKY